MSRPKGSKNKQKTNITKVRVTTTEIPTSKVLKVIKSNDGTGAILYTDKSFDLVQFIKQ